MNFQVIYQIIKDRLLSSGSVALPKIGVLESKEKPAVFSEDGVRISPPRKVLALNSKDTGRDYALDREYAKRLQMPINEAIAQIDDFGAFLKQRLGEGESVVIDGVGTLAPSGNEAYMFTQDESLVLDPEGFGLRPYIADKAKGVDSEAVTLSPAFKAAYIIAIVIAVLAILAACVYISKEPLMPLLEKILYTDEELSILNY